MTTLAGHARHWDIELSRSEFTGALGDSVTVLPIVVAVAALTELSLGRLLLGFAAFQVIWGVHYGLPISVEPMKALAALVIAGSLTTGELVVAGLLAGVVLLLVGTTGALARIERHVGQPVIRGVQLAVGLVLLETGIQLSLDGVGYALLALAAVAVSVAVGRPRTSTLLVIGLGVAVGVTQTGLPDPRLPAIGVTLPTVADASSASLGATVGQLAMTVGNAAVATSLLLSDYFDADVSADELATSMGAMNLLAVPLGAMPMCHGSGGVAGKYAFGARTAGANLILGILYALAAVLAVGVVAAFPLAMLGVVLAVIAVELGRAGLDTDDLPLTVGIGVLGVLTNVGVAFVVGVAVQRVRLWLGSEPDRTAR
ncbi:putative sulfate/molybdate transporter [Halobellus limi]|jgi:MFS superfamily sulfate permease-like transporter|uniref:Sulfate permease, MFS superfamily n=1 Tax=Halobellus limi TaxID=699433 RepID=A0A1H5T330_9EURY|nr:putative sulfate/molybdate transporter [Halobellus limi]QCC47419.1 sulfate transporter [Halobellus limi]SEF57213.1 Sulfate permease, MFS superfamily [Halobellus limi]